MFPGWFIAVNGSLVIMLYYSVSHWAVTEWWIGCLLVGVGFLVGDTGWVVAADWKVGDM